MILLRLRGFIIVAWRLIVDNLWGVEGGRTLSFRATDRTGGAVTLERNSAPVFRELVPETGEFLRNECEESAFKHGS